MKATLPMEKMRFASCARVARLLKILPEAARRAVDGEALFLNFPAVRNFSDDFTQVTTSNNINLTRREIFRGKVSLRKNQQNNQQNKTDLEERTQPAPNS
jgi:hypothetical protein